MTATGYQIMKRKTTEALKAELGKAPEKVVISLPWPCWVLSPNSRPHWATKAKYFRNYKADCSAVLNDMKHRHHVRGKYEFRITFRPPTRRKADTDNMLASFKAGLDALSIVTGVDDSLFVYTLARGEPVKGGAVEIEVIG